jgi:hypothetical protein
MNDHTESITNNRDRTHTPSLYFLLFPDIYFSLTCPVEAHPPSPSPVHVSPTLTTLSSPLKRDPHFPILFRWQHTPPSSSFFFFSVIDLLIASFSPLSFSTAQPSPSIEPTPHLPSLSLASLFCARHNPTLQTSSLFTHSNRI